MVAEKCLAKERGFDMSGRIFSRFLALGLVLSLAGSAHADRLTSTRTGGQKSSGSRVDQTVPWLTHGTNAFQGYNVAPQIKASPSVSDKVDPGAKPVYNIPFYGGKQAFGSGSEGAVQRPFLPPRTTTK
jgi:hypothetical protein